MSSKEEIYQLGLSLLYGEFLKKYGDKKPSGKPKRTKAVPVVVTVKNEKPSKPMLAVVSYKKTEEA